MFVYWYDFGEFLREGMNIDEPEILLMIFGPIFRLS